MLWQFRLADRFGWAALEGWERLPAQAQAALRMIMVAESEARPKPD